MTVRQPGRRFGGADRFFARIALEFLELAEDFWPAARNADSGLQKGGNGGRGGGISWQIAHRSRQMKASRGSVADLRTKRAHRRGDVKDRDGS